MWNEQPQEQVNAPQRKTVLRRMLVVRWMLLFLFFGCIIRLYHLQVNEGEKWQSLSRQEHQRRTKVLLKRGPIKDRFGSNLAVSAEVKSLYAVPPLVADRTYEVAIGLQKILGFPLEKTLQKLGKKKSFVWLERALKPDQVEKIAALKIPGLRFEQEFKRVYPRGSLASHLLGWVGDDNEGLLDNLGRAGLEYSFDAQLRGSKINITRQRTHTGSNYGNPDEPSNKGGLGLQLTLDEVIQHIIEQELEKAWTEWNPEWGCVVVMDPHTGEILGLTNRPTYDSSDISTSTAETRRNHAIFDLFEPGSVFKMFTFAAAKEFGELESDDKFHCSGSISFKNGKYKMRCHGVVHGYQTPAEVFANSCNVCSVQVAQKIGSKHFSEFIDRLDLKKPKKLLPGMAIPRALIRERKKWSLLSLPSLSIGQEVSLTPIQLLTAGCSVLNAGILMEPMLIRSMETTHGKIKQNFPVIKGRIMDAKSAEYIQKLLRQVVVTGSGREANIPGYNVSGKTGTGQIANPKGGYFEGRWTTSFLGFINEADYQLGILVTLKNPKPKPGQTKDVSGGMVAAPVFRRIVERILMFKQILPINMRSHTVVRISERQQDYRVPDVSGMTLEDVEAKLSGEVDIMARGNGPLVVKQFPPAQRLMSRRDKLLVFLGNGDDLAVNRMFRKEPFMRHFIGKSMREAVEMLQGFDQSVYFEGSGFVVEQSPGAGTPLQKESQISLKFSPLKR